jgi:hypothetical protein
MKKILLSVVALVAVTFSASAQISVRGVSPAAIVGNKVFTWADPASWGQTPDFNIPNTFVQDTIVFVEDGSTGTNPQGNPVSQEGCFALTNGVDVAGKIAMVYRNTCEFGTKAYNAQLAGAVGVIIVNRLPEAVGMGAGVQGPNVTIPCVMITDFDGAALKAQMAMGPVVMFLGNKIGLFGNDLTISPENAKIPTSAGVSKLLSNNIFDPAVKVYNYGSNAGSNVMVNLKINGPGMAGPAVYDNTITAASVPSNDSVTVVAGGSNIFPTLDLAALAVGDYFLRYTAMSDSVDQDSIDNVYASTFKVNTNFLSLSRLDAGNNPVHNSYPQNTTNPGVYEACMSFTNPAASDVMVTGVKYVPSADTALVNMTGEQVTFTIYEWSAPNDLTTLVTPPVYSSVTYLASNADNKTVKFHAFDDAVPLVDDMVYLVCAQSTAIETIVFGYDNTLDYSGNETYDILLASPIYIADTWYTGWSGTSALSLALELKANTVGIEEQSKLDAVAFPNPTHDVLNIRVNAAGDATIVITDLTGKTVANHSVVIANNSTMVNTSKLEAGAYIMTVTAANGASTKLNIIKN